MYLSHTHSNIQHHLLQKQGEIAFTAVKVNPQTKSYPKHSQEKVVIKTRELRKFQIHVRQILVQCALKEDCNLKLISHI